MRAIPLFAIASVLVGASTLASCSWAQPQVGEFRGSCSGQSGYAMPDGGYAGGGAAGSAGGGVDPRCLPGSGTADGDCDNCSNANCCAERFGCYDDGVCACSDEALDDCLADLASMDADAAVGEGGAPDTSAAAVACWSDFSASGARAQARIACERTSCKVECGIPDF